MNWFKKIEVNGRELVVFLPPSYDTEEGRERRYPVAYVQDGGEMFKLISNTLQHLMLQGKLPEVLFIGVKTNNRNLEYTPWPAPPLLESYEAFGGGARVYLDDLADIVKPYVDCMFRTKPEREYTAVIGGSFGGLISLFGGLWRPDTFGLLGLLSASFWFEGVMPFLREREAPDTDLRIYMSVGDCEGIYKTNIQRNMVAASKEAYELWAAKGFPSERMRFRLQEGGTHDALTMAGNLTHAIHWLFQADAADKADKLPALRGISPLERTGYVVPRTEVKEIVSRATGRAYRIFIYEPAEPAPAEGYPVLYTLDANASFASIAEAMILQVRGPRGLQPCIVVGIGYDSEGPIVTKERFWDYTDPADESELRARPDGSPWPANGGAADFAAFIEDELKPAVETLYHVDRSRQALFGHSLGGYYVLRTLLARPDSFQTYIAGSPSIWWKNHDLLKQLPELERRVSAGEIKANLLIAVGAREANMVDDAEKLYDRLLPLANKGAFRLSFRKFEEEEHMTVIHPLISELLRVFAVR
ncbi:alpha/beta hydrolase [Paenibacillus sp. strain BS8-2]